MGANVGAESRAYWLVELGLKEGKVNDWKWIRDPKVLLWIIAVLIGLLWLLYQIKFG
jgi:hypothetical protein